MHGGSERMYLGLIVSTAVHTPSVLLLLRPLCLRLNSPVKPQASARRKVLQDMRKKSAVSSRGKQRSLVNLVT